MPTYSSRAQAALLKAANNLFSLDRPAESIEELSNGVIFAKILHELDPEFDPAHLESETATSRYLTNKRNLQAVYKGLFRFIRRQVPELSCQARKFNYHAVAENPEPQGLSQLLAVMVSAATMGPNNKKYVPMIQTSLDNVTQAEIMQIIRNMQLDAANSKDDESLDEAIDDIMEARDMDLLVEEQNVALRQQLEMTKKTLSDYITRLEHLQISHEELKYEKEKNDRELEVMRKASKDGAHSAEAIRILEDQVHEQMEIIAKNEETIRAHDKIKAQLESEVQKLTLKSRQADELRDQATEWRHKAEELEKKANTAERYKQKLESQQHLVKEVQNLQYEKAELQEQLRSMLDDHERSGRTRKAEDELTKMLTQSEQHLWDERSQKTQLLKDITTLEEELLRLRAQRTHDEHFIQDLQEQLQQSGGMAAGETLPEAPASFSLEEELNDAAGDGGQQPNLTLVLSRLKAENDLLRSTVGSTGDAVSLRKDLEEQKKRNEHLQDSFNDIFEKHTIVKEQIEALMKGSADESSQTFIKVRSELTRVQKEHEATKKEAAELKTRLTDRDRELMSTKTELSAVEKDGISALNELKSTDKLISESLKAELDRVREEIKVATVEREAQKSQLIEALLAKDKLRKEMEELKETQDTAAIEAATQDATEAGKKAAEKIEKLRERLIERKQQLEQAEQDKVDLQKLLKAAQGGEASAAQKAASDQIIRNLERENALMATAWYDLTSRIQSNHIVLQRRPDAPKSWLNKQRQMVNGQLRQRDSLYLY